MKVAEEKSFFWVGRVASADLAAFGLSAFFFLEAAMVVRCIDITPGTSAACVVSMRFFSEALANVWFI